MSNQSQGILSHLYPAFVCFMLILGPDISGERLQDHWSSGLNFGHCKCESIIASSSSTVGRLSDENEGKNHKIIVLVIAL